MTYRICHLHPGGIWKTKSGKPTDPPKSGDWVYVEPGEHPDLHIPPGVSLGRLTIKSRNTTIGIRCGHNIFSVTDIDRITSTEKEKR